MDYNTRFCEQRLLIDALRNSDKCSDLAGCHVTSAQSTYEYRVLLIYIEPIAKLEAVDIPLHENPLTLSPGILIGLLNTMSNYWKVFASHVVTVAD